MLCYGSLIRPVRTAHAVRCVTKTSEKLHNFTTSTIFTSGHNRWSKIRHDKAANDASKNRQRSAFAKEIATISKLFGSDLSSNPRLADLVTKAKKSGFAKHSIDAAIARGQGRSATGESLESAIVEAILPGNLGLLIDCETDNRARTIQDLRSVIKKHGGTSSPSSYLFSKQGRVVFESKSSIEVDDSLEVVINAGALDIWSEENGAIVISTEPSETRQVGEVVGKALGLQITSSDIIWTPIETTMTSLDNKEIIQDFSKMIDELNLADSSIRGIYMNIARGQVGEEDWNDLESKLT